MGANDLFGVPRNADVSGGYTKLETPQSIKFSAGFGVVDPALTIYQTYRLGDRLIGKVRFTCGTVAASSGNFTLPRGLNINANFYKNLPAGTGVNMGTWVCAVAPGGTAAEYASASAGTVNFDGADTTTLYLSYRISTSGNGGYINDNVTAYLASASVVDVDFNVPIAQWAV